MASVLFVCLGNICRSPTAEGVFRELVRKAGLQSSISTDSAGTSAWHIEEAPDSRTLQCALNRGYDFSDLRGRQVIKSDFNSFDYILAMDAENLRDLQAICPADYKGHVGLFLDFAKKHNQTEVPDPYHGGSKGFERVLDLIEDASEGLLEHLKSRL